MTELEQKLLNTVISRRTGLRMGMLAIAGTATSMLLAACGGDDDDDDSGDATEAAGGSDETATEADSDATEATDETETEETEESTEAAGTEEEATEEETEAGDQETGGEGGEVDRSAVGGQLILGRSGDSDSLDPKFTNASISWEVFSNIYDPLLARDADLQYEPLVAESFEASEDGLTYTFKVRDGLKFHDGTPVNAEAVAFTFNRILDPDAPGPTVSWLGPLESVEAVDELTAQFNLESPFSPLLGNAAASAYYGIVSPTAVDELGDDFGKQPVGSGPFKFKEWVSGETITLERYDDYVNYRSINSNKGAAYLEGLVFRNIPEEQTQVAALQTGEINLVALPPQQVEDFKADDNYNVLISDSSTSISFLEFSMDDSSGKLDFVAPVNDIAVRKAMAYAIDAQTIIDRVLFGLAVRNFGLQPTGNLGYTPDIEEFGYHYDPDQAKSVLEEAGWVEGDGGIREKDGTPLHVVFWTWSDTTQQRVAEVIQAQLAEVGIDAKLEVMEVATLLARLTDDNQSQIDLMGWGWSEADLLYMMTSGESQFGLYQEYSPEYKEEVTAARETSDLDERAAHYFEAMKIALADVAAVPLWSAVSAWGSRAELKGLFLDPKGYRNYLDTYIEL